MTCLFDQVLKHVLLQWFNRPGPQFPALCSEARMQTSTVHSDKVHKAMADCSKQTPTNIIIPCCGWKLNISLPILILYYSVHTANICHVKLFHHTDNLKCTARARDGCWPNCFSKKHDFNSSFIFAVYVSTPVWWKAGGIGIAWVEDTVMYYWNVLGPVQYQIKQERLERCTS